MSPAEMQTLRERRTPFARTGISSSSSRRSGTMARWDARSTAIRPRSTSHRDGSLAALECGARTRLPSRRHEADGPSRAAAIGPRRRTATGWYVACTAGLGHNQHIPPPRSGQKKGEVNRLIVDGLGHRHIEGVRVRQGTTSPREGRNLPTSRVVDEPAAEQQELPGVRRSFRWHARAYRIL